MYELEEWACIFPDAAIAGDTEFIEKVIASLRPCNSRRKMAAAIF
jgi:hypothetical protein